MTIIDLLQHYPPYKDFTHHDKAPDKLQASNGKTPDPTMPDTYPSHYLDARTKQLQDMHDIAVKHLASSQREPVSEYAHTFWRSPHAPKPSSPTYSEISDSFESPDMIENRIGVLLSTAMSPMSTQFKGPEGLPLGVEIAMNDFRRGRLSTPILQEDELIKPMNVRKRKQQMPWSGGNGNEEGQEAASCENVPPTQHSYGQHQQEGECLQPLAFQKQQDPVPLQSYGKEQDHLDSVSLKPLVFQQQGCTHPQQQSTCPPLHSRVDLNTPESQVQSGKEIDSDDVHIPTLCARKYGDDQASCANASSELHPVLADGKLPIGLDLENACLQRSIFQLRSEVHNGSHNQRDHSYLIQKVRPQTALSDLVVCNQAKYEETHNVEPRFNALRNALDEEYDSARTLGAYESTGRESIDCETGCQKTSEDRENDTLQGIELQTSRDSGADLHSEFLSWTALEDILEESEDSFTSTLTLDQGQPQHFALGSAEPLDLHRSSWVDEGRDSMPALQESQTNVSTISLRPPRVLPKLKSPIDSSSTPQLDLTEPSTHRPIDMKSSEPTLSATTLAELKDSTRKKGRLSAAALAEMRKTAKSQPHFQTGPSSLKDQSQADIHPLLRSKSFSRPLSQPFNLVNDSPLRYTFVDDDSDHHEAEETDSFSRQVTPKPRSSHRPETPDSKIYVKQESMKEHPSQLGKTKDDIVQRYLCNDDNTEAECVGTSTPQKSTLRFSNLTTLVPSPENATPPSSTLSKANGTSAVVVGSPEAMESVVLQPSTSPPTAGYYPELAFGSPAAYNSWASTPHRHKQGNCCSTPSSAATVPTSTLPTPDISFHGSSHTSLGTTMTPSSSFGQLAGDLPKTRGMPMTPSSSFGTFPRNRSERRSISASSMLARYQKARYPDLQTAAMTDTISSSKESAEKDQAKEITNDPFTSTRDDSTSFSLNLKVPSKEDLVDALNVETHQFSTPTKRSSGRFSLHRRSLSISTSERPKANEGHERAVSSSGRFSLHRRGRSTSERPKTNEGLERAVSTMLFKPHRSRLHKRSHSISGSIDTTTKPDSSSAGIESSLSIATNAAEQHWERAPPATPLALRDDFSMRYRSEELEANDHYSSRKDAAQGKKQGWKNVFGRK